MARTQKKIDWLLVTATAVLGPALGAGMALLSRGFIEERQLADKPYVEKRFEAGMKYTDDKAAQILREALEHSDANKQAMKLEMERMNTEVQTSNARMAGKMDVVLEKIEGLSVYQRKHK